MVIRPKIGNFSWITTTRLPHTDYYLTIKRIRNSKWQKELENGTSKLHYIKPRIEEYESVHNSCIKKI